MRRQIEPKMVTLFWGTDDEKRALMLNMGPIDLPPDTGGFKLRPY